MNKLKLFLILLFSVSGLAQTSVVDCLKNSLVNSHYYIDGNKIIKGYELGEMDLYVEIDYEKSNKDFIALIVSYEESNKNRQALLGANCNKVIIGNNHFYNFKIKKHLNSSDNNG